MGMHGDEPGEVKLLVAVVAQAAADVADEDRTEDARRFFAGAWYRLICDWLEIGDVTRGRVVDLVR